MHGLRNDFVLVGRRAEGPGRSAPPWSQPSVRLCHRHSGIGAAAALLPRESGPQVEHHARCPPRTRCEAGAVTSPRRVTVRGWERGAGPTLACGTGACAVTVAGILRGVLESPVAVALPGGTLQIEWE